VDFDLTTEQENIRRLARDFCDAEVARRPGSSTGRRPSPTSSCRSCSRWASSARRSPRSTAGWALDYLSYGLIVEELGRTDASIRSMVSVNVGLVALSILKWGTEEQKQEWLPRLCGEGLGAFGLTEPDAGSDPSRMTTAARAVTATTGSSTARRCSSRTAAAASSRSSSPSGPVQGRRKGITAFLVPQDSDGYEGTRSTASSACGRATPRRSPAPTCASRTATGSVRSARG
jgi:alkylation response protein AidB-like acyl-CoA dehydrogenase